MSGRMDWEGAKRREKAADDASDEYRIVTATVLSVGAKAFRLALRSGGEAWVPRSVIHGADDAKIDDLKPGRGKEWTFRLRAWKAEQLGLA